MKIDWMKLVYDHVITDRVIIVAIIVFGCFFCVKILSTQLDRTLYKKVRDVVFYLYLVVIIYISLFSREKNVMWGIDLELFSSFRKAFYMVEGVIYVNALDMFEEVILNILMFMPWGYFMLEKTGMKQKGTVIVYALLFSSMIEITQYIFRLGWFDIDDLINNLIGTMLGIAGCSILHKKVF